MFSIVDEHNDYHVYWKNNVKYANLPPLSKSPAEATPIFIPIGPQSHTDGTYFPAYYDSGYLKYLDNKE